MRLLIDAGNTRLKWRLESATGVSESGTAMNGVPELLSTLSVPTGKVRRIALSTVVSEDRRLALQSDLQEAFSAPVCCYWAESQRRGLVSAYDNPCLMGADRWHAMYAAWVDCREGVAVIDAGSAVTVDYVDRSGRHLGGYILPGLQMMVRSLKTDAARIGFDPEEGLRQSPGHTTAECVNHGLAWLWQSMVARIGSDVAHYGLADVLVTGGDGPRLSELGLQSIYRPALVLDGLALIDAEAASA